VLRRPVETAGVLSLLAYFGRFKPFKAVNHFKVTFVMARVYSAFK